MLINFWESHLTSVTIVMTLHFVKVKQRSFNLFNNNNNSKNNDKSNNNVKLNEYCKYWENEWMNKNILNTVTWPHNTGIMMEYEYTFNTQRLTILMFIWKYWKENQK